jgi:hypothetical protein
MAPWIRFPLLEELAELRVELGIEAGEDPARPPRARRHAVRRLAPIGTPLPAQPFITITEQRAGIRAAIEHGLSNARVEASTPPSARSPDAPTDFHSPDALIALAKLTPQRPLPTTTRTARLTRDNRQETPISFGMTRQPSTRKVRFSNCPDPKLVDANGDEIAHADLA